MRLTATGLEATGLTPTNFDLTYVRSGAAPAAKVDASALASTSTAHTDNGAIEVDATNMPGLYRVDWPDAAFAAGVREVILSVKCATAFTEHLRVELETVQGGDNFARLGAPAGASVSADIAAVKSDTATNLTRIGTPANLGSGPTLAQNLSDIEAQTDDIGAAGAGLTAIPSVGNVTSAVTVGTNNDKTGYALSAAGVSAVQAGLSTLTAGQVNAEVDTGLADVGLTPTVTGRIDTTVSSRATPAQILTTALTEAYAADGVAPTLSQGVFLLLQALTEFAIVGTTITVKRLDGSTTAATYTLDSATTPTSRTRTT